MDARELLKTPFAYMPPSRILDGLSAEQSEARIARASHSVVETLAHLVFWQSWFLGRCAGASTPMVETATAGWPAANATDWESLKAQFLNGIEGAVALALDGSISARRIEPAIEFEPFADYTVQDAVTHVAIHNAHHLGQIITLRQILGAWPPPDGSWTW